MMKGKVVFELTNVGSKSEGCHPFFIMEDGKKVKLGLLGDNPFMHTKLKAYDQKDVIVEGDFNDNGKFIATSIQEDKPEQESEVKEVVPVEEEPHVKTVCLETEPCSCEMQDCEQEEEICCQKESCQCDENACEEDSCCKKVPCEDCEE